jgi:hypothetical protein
LDADRRCETRVNAQLLLPSAVGQLGRNAPTITELKMQFWYEEVWAEESGGSDFQEVATIDFQETLPVLVETWLTQVTQQGSNGSAYVLITSYVQNGNPINGEWHSINGNGISSVTFRLTVKNCRAYATCRALAIDE